MTEKELKQAIKKVVKDHYLGRKIKFKTSGGEGETFKVVAYKIHSRKSIGIERDEFEDYGIDEDTKKFVYVEFWDAESQFDAMGCTACIFTLNAKGQVGTCDGPYHFEYTVAYDTAIEMADQIMGAYNELKKSRIQEIAEELANLSPAEVELLRFACGNDNPLACPDKERQ